MRMGTDRPIATRHVFQCRPAEGDRVHLAYTEEQEALKQELRAYFAELVTPEVAAETAAGESGGPACLEAVRQIGRDRWLGVGWPEEYGGRGFGPVEQFIFMNESWRAGAPVPFLSINTVGQTIMQFGTQEQKDFFLPKILAGDRALLDRLHRAELGHRPRLAQDQGRSRTATSG